MCLRFTARCGPCTTNVYQSNHEPGIKKTTRLAMKNRSRNKTCAGHDLFSCISVNDIETSSLVLRFPPTRVHPPRYAQGQHRLTTAPRAARHPGRPYVIGIDGTAHLPAWICPNTSKTVYSVRHARSALL